MSDNEHTTASLGNSGKSAVENSVADSKPEFGQRLKHDSEVPTAVRGEKSGYVLQEDPASPAGEIKLFGDASELEEKPRAFSCESGSSAGDTEVLTGESSAEDVCCARYSAYQPYVLFQRCVWKMRGEDTTPPGVDLALERDADSGSLEGEVEASDSGEE